VLRNEEKAKKNEIIKNAENDNTVVCNITEIFLFLDKRVLDFNVT
jgi:hypothetical protein